MRVLGVGINKYPDSPLRGCVNDISITRELVKKYKYIDSNSDVRILFDDRAPTYEIEERMKWWIAEPMVHSNILFHYSGHGAQIPIVDYKNNQEFDGMDEIICPHDFNWEDHFINDNFIAKILGRKPPTTKAVMIFDCCHSGTIYRDTKKWIVYDSKCLNTPEDMMMRVPTYDSNTLSLLSGDSIRPIDIDLLQKPPIKKKEVLEVHNCIIISGCKDYQTSADARMPSGLYHGALSYFLQRIWYQNPNISVPDLETAVRTELRKAGFSQEPVFSYGPGTDLSKLF